MGITSPVIVRPMNSIFVKRPAETSDPQVAGEQRTAGQSPIRRMVVGASTDPAEREADVMADHAMAVLDGGGSAAPVRHATSAGSKVRRLATVGAAGGALDDSTSREIDSARGGGRPLESKIKRSMEGAFGADFSNIRMHVGAQSDDLNDRISARAFTTGNDVFVRSEDYSPSTSSGQHLLAHELAHTVQQGGSTINRSALGGDTTIRRLMSPGKFKSKSGGVLSGTRSRVLAVDKALTDVTGAYSKSVALDKLINECNTYLSGPGSKDSTRVKGVKALLAEAITELTQWRMRARIPFPDFVFRMDERAPAVIAQVGFQPWNPAGTLSIIEHVKGAIEVARADVNGKSGAVGAGAKPHSQFVSTAADLEFAKDPVLAQGLPGKYFYKISTAAAPDTYTDVGEHFDGQQVANPFEKQLEFIQRGGIPGNQVVEYIAGKDVIGFALGEDDASALAWTPMPVAAI